MGHSVSKSPAAGGLRRRPWKEGLFYELQLNGPAPDRFHLSIPDPLSGNEAHLGTELREALNTNPAAFWMEGGRATSPWFQHFSWLRDCRAMGEAGRPIARTLADGWLANWGKYTPEQWAPDLVSARLWALAQHGQWLTRHAEVTWRSAFLTSVARQTRHLSKVISYVEPPQSRLMAALSLTMMGLALSYHQNCQEQGATLLRREMKLQLRSDGGHIGRNPSFQLQLVLRLQALYTAYRLAGETPPSFLYHAISRATGLLEFFRCGDGHLAVFNGGTEDHAGALAAALSFDSTPRRQIDFASQSGYHRLTGARTSVYADTGRAGDEGSGFDSAFSLEMSTGRQRLIVNCGAVTSLWHDVPGGLPRAAEWNEVLSGAAAHSGLEIEEMPVSPARVQETSWYSNMEENQQGQLLELERTNLPGWPGLTHRRRLFLSVDGDDLRGEDTIVPPPGEEMPGWVLRFHLHPGVRASLSRDGGKVMCVTPGNTGWIFRASGVDMALEPSVYAGGDSGPQPTMQITLRPREERKAACVKWAFRRG